ncbi:unnamed protein product [Prorocentrum cordatum]|uniref:Uncharacterized protein n=1 Tax=Prorocentrum cordatum TaxID=2364126 RepID=A0ABN9T4Y1_9DINO|nr:unnamed protein product [Polarella glacialis]
MRFNNARTINSARMNNNVLSISVGSINSVVIRNFAWAINSNGIINGVWVVYKVCALSRMRSRRTQIFCLQMSATLVCNERCCNRFSISEAPRGLWPIFSEARCKLSWTSTRRKGSL